jgi:predicted RNA-binding protein with PUA-like domain
MNYWLIKSEPSVWSFNDQKKIGSKGTVWDGVRNYQAANYLKQMKSADLCFFYHSNEDKKIIGIVKIIKSAFIDPTDKGKKFVAVRVAYYKDLIEPISLANIKENKEICHLPLIKQSRLSVMPIDSKSWKIICKMGRV